jgi:elongation factor 2
LGGINAKDDPKVRGKYLQDNYNWDKNEGAEKLWCFGPENSGANVLVDVTKAVQYMQEIRDSCSSAFQWATKQGVLTEEPMRGVRMNIMDTVLHTDSIHRGDGQIIPAARRLYYSSELTAEPRLQEPVFMVEITVPLDSTGGVYTCLNKRRGLIVEEETISGTPMSIIKSYLPVSESFGFTENLRGLTKGKAFPQCVFHHWDTIESSPLEKGS